MGAAGQAIRFDRAPIAVFGFVSLGKLRVDLLPEISYPTVTVRTTYKGAAPEDIEDRISEHIQEALSTLPHLVRSTFDLTRAEVSDIVLDFDWGTAMTVRGAGRARQARRRVPARRRGSR